MKIKYGAGLVAIALVSLSSCKKLGDFGDTNVNPNGSSTVSTGTLLATSLGRMGNANFGTVLTTASPAVELLPGYFCQYFAQPTYPVASRYALPQVASSGAYSGTLKDLQVVIDRNTDPASQAVAAQSGDNNSQIAMARILKAYIYWELTDKWGNMPYTQALKGTAFLNPKYDSQESIYVDLLKELTEAVDQFSGANNVTSDIVYAGNEAKWKKFANTLRMLMSLRLSERYPAAGEYAATQFSAAASHVGGFITSNADNFTLVYPANANPFNNPWNGPGNSADNAVSKTLTDLLAGLTDTRGSAFASNANGVPYGLDVPAPTGTAWGRILAPSFKATTSPLVLVAASSSLLAQAEAIERGWISGDSKAAYNAGVTASFAQWGVTIPADYLTSSATSFDIGSGVVSIGGSSVAGSNATTSNKIQRINLQQYLAFYPSGYHGWSNFRRTGIPDLKPTIFATSDSKQIPKRYVYGTNEYSLNLEQVTVAETEQGLSGSNRQDIPVWWDKN